MEDISEEGIGGVIHLKGIHVGIGRKSIKLNSFSVDIQRRNTKLMKGIDGFLSQTISQCGQSWCGQGFVYQDTHSLFGSLCTKDSLCSVGLDSIWTYLLFVPSVSTRMKHRIIYFLNVPLQRRYGISSVQNGG